MPESELNNPACQSPETVMSSEKILFASKVAFTHSHQNM